MKKQIFILFVACVFLYACKKEKPAAVQEPAQAPKAVQGASAAAMQDCKLLAENLPPCSPFSCSREADMFGVVINNIFTIKGVEDKRCILVQEMESEGEKEEVMTCALNRLSAEQLARYYKTYFDSDGDMSFSISMNLGGVVSQSETIDGKEVINPLGDLFASGICITKGMQQSDMEVELSEGTTMEITNPDGTVTVYTGGADGKTTKTVK